MNDHSGLEKNTGVHFKNNGLLQLALTHSSYINENPGTLQDSNERLEFLGDAVLGLAISNKLYRDHPGANEGDLTRLRSALVRKETLAEMANKIKLGDYLYFGKGEESGGGRKKAANLASAFEAFIAAVYLDQGMEAAADFILRLFDKSIFNQAHINVSTDYKSKLQELMQRKFQITPAYAIVEATGPDHSREFKVVVKLGDQILAEGKGKSKKAAEMEAAHHVLLDYPDE